MEDQSTIKKKLSFRVLFKILKDTFQGFSDDNVMRLSASLAYATLFSIIPFLSLLITIGTFLQIDLTNQLYAHLKPILGVAVVEQLSAVIGNAEKPDSSTLAVITTLGVTIFGATTIFAEIPGSLNAICGLQAISKRG